MMDIYKIQEDLGIEDAEILRAIEIHTVGSGTMSELDKVVYVADYIEHNRDFPGEGQITVGNLVTFISYLDMLVWPLMAIGFFFNIT